VPDITGLVIAMAFSVSITLILLTYLIFHIKDKKKKAK
jgi:hypothetical protein